MEEDDDAFLYGDEGDDAGQAKSIAVTQDPAAALKAEVPLEVSNGIEEDAMHVEDEEEEDGSDEEDSDSVSWRLFIPMRKRELM